jgi:hypothetical protein
MSLDINVYCRNLSADLVPKIVKRLKQSIKEKDFEYHEFDEWE